MNERKFNGSGDSGGLGGMMSGNPQIAGLISKMSPEDMEKLRGILNDPAMARSILATPQAQSVIRMLKKNGPPESR